jgi:O-antigen/teichoic acid export membrane protein
MTGTTIAQALPIAISPILTRIYTPEDFGLFALFLAITAIIGSVANGRYELAIMLPEEDEDAINTAALGFIISSLLSLLILILVILFNKFFVNLIGNEEIGLWLYFVPITVFLIGLWNVLNYYNNRKKNYKDLRNAHIIRSIALASTHLIIGFLKSGVTGLISGEILSKLFANSRLLKNIFKDKLLISKITKRKMLNMAKRYKNFPMISLPSSFTTELYSNLFSVLLSSLYNVALLGHYYMAQRVLGLPSALIGVSIGQVFFQSAVKEREKTGQARVIFRSTVKKLFLIALPFFVTLFFVVEDLFAFVFGENWRVAGTYSQILIPIFFIRLLTTPVSMINTVFERQIYGLYISIILFVSNMGIILGSYYLGLGPEKMFTILSIVLFIEYSLFLLHYYLLSGGDYISRIFSESSR